MPMTAKLPAIWAVRKRMQRCFVLPNFAGRLQALRLFPPFVSFASQNAHGSGAGVVTGVNFACPFAITGVIPFSFHLAAEINKLGYVYF